jgi:hypothetical protein
VYCVPSCVLFRWDEHYDAVIYPSLKTWKDVIAAIPGGCAVTDEVLGYLAKMCTVGARWGGSGLKDGSVKPKGLKIDGRLIGPQLKLQWAALPEVVRIQIQKMRSKMARSTLGWCDVDVQTEISIIGVNAAEEVKGYFYKADLGVVEECKDMMAKHENTVRAFLIHLTDEDKVDKAQFAVCMRVIREMARDDAFVVQVCVSLLSKQ